MGTVFNPGEVVKLKSGGAPMTVHSVDADGQVNCFWHSYQGELCSQKFAQHVLEISELVK